MGTCAVNGSNNGRHAGPLVEFVHHSALFLCCGWKPDIFCPESSDRSSHTVYNAANRGLMDIESVAYHQLECPRSIKTKGHQQLVHPGYPAAMCWFQVDSNLHKSHTMDIS